MSRRRAAPKGRLWPGGEAPRLAARTEAKLAALAALKRSVSAEDANRELLMQRLRVVLTDPICPSNARALREGIAAVLADFERLGYGRA